MRTRLRGRAHHAADWVGEADLVGAHAADWRPNDLARLLEAVPQRLGLPSVPAFERGDLLLSGRGFGDDAVTDWPALLLSLHGFGALLSESIRPAFRDACLHAGLPVLVLPGIRELVRPGDDLIVSLDACTIENVSTHRMLLASGLSETELRWCREAPSRALLGIQETTDETDAAESPATVAGSGPPPVPGR